MTRREVLKIACLFSAGGVLWSIPKNTEAKFFLRPPGAKDEKKFCGKLHKVRTLRGSLSIRHT